jgi:ketosteroid isomerase-like protein
VNAEEGIRRTLAEFCQVTDAGDFDRWVDLFTPDGSMVLLGETHTGSDALRAFIIQDQPPESRGLHITTDSIIDVDGDTAHASSNFLFIGATPSGPAIIAAGQYIDQLARHGERWLFVEREATLFALPRVDEPWGNDPFDPDADPPWWMVRRPSDDVPAPTA